MTNLADIEQYLTEVLDLPQRPVAVAFCDAPPAGVAKFTGSAPAGCNFWRLAAEGRAFYTVPADHYNCAIGSYTHNLPLPPERQPEMEATLGLMVEIGYLRMEEVPGIPRLAKTPAAIVYTPLAAATLPPDVVLLAGRPGKLMLLQEAAIRAGVAANLPLLGRPTCMALPASLTGGVVFSTGCIGNRVYTDVGEDQLYVAVPGQGLARVAEALETVAAANAQLASYHAERRAALTRE